MTRTECRRCQTLGRVGRRVLLGLTLLLAAEGLARWWVPQDPVRRVYDPFAYRIPQPGLELERA